MSGKQRDWSDACRRIEPKQLQVLDAAEEKGLSPRRMERVWKRFRVLGDAGRMHQTRGRPSFGSMVQMDGSHNDWFAGRGPACRWRPTRTWTGMKMVTQAFAV